MTKKQSLFFLFSIFFAVELASFLTIDNHLASGIAAILLTLLVAVLTWKNLSYGIYALLIELVLGGKGYLFSLTIGGMRIPLRMLLFCTVIGIWFLTSLLRNKKFVHLRQLFGALWWPYISLVAMVAIGIILGFYKQNGWGAVFLDANAFGYLLLAPAFLEVLQKEENRKQISQIWLAVTFWLAVKTIILFVIFSMFGRESMDYLYRWIRNSGVGEVTWLSGVRVFLYSQIFIVGAWLYVLFNNFEERIKKSAPILILFSTAILISLSRSFFVGIVVAIIFICAYLLWQKKFNDLKIIIIRFLI